MKNLKFYFFLLLFLNITSLYAQEQLYRNLAARGDDGADVFFSFDEKAISSQEKAWDIAFNRTTISINGQYKVLDIPFEQVEKPSRPEEMLEGKYPLKDWYEYNMEGHTIETKKEMVYLLKTARGWYKFQVISYYKDAPQVPDSGKDLPGYFTFRFEAL